MPANATGVYSVYTGIQVFKVQGFEVGCCIHGLKITGN